LAGFLFNFLSGRVLVEVGPSAGGFTKAATEIGYEVHHVEPQNTIGSLAASKSLPDTVDFLSIAHQYLDLEILKALDWIQPAIIQAEFEGPDLHSSRDNDEQKAPVSVSEIITELRKREYYWNVIIFRTEAEALIRMGTNLVGVPSQSWGKILFFRDHQLFLKAFHWCKTTPPRFRAAR